MMEALIVFAKPPVAGRVKTRLYTLLSPDEAAQLYEAFLDDSLDQYRSLGPYHRKIAERYFEESSK